MLENDVVAGKVKLAVDDLNKLLVELTKAELECGVCVHDIGVPLQDKVVRAPQVTVIVKRTIAEVG